MNLHCWKYEDKNGSEIYKLILEKQGVQWTSEIARKLNIEEELYCEIVKKHNGINHNHWLSSVFKTEQDVNKLIIELEPYLIMANLTE